VREGYVEGVFAWRRYGLDGIGIGISIGTAKGVGRLELVDWFQSHSSEFVKFTVIGRHTNTLRAWLIFCKLRIYHTSGRPRSEIRHAAGP
jgi:hypothetical protein